MPQLMKFKATSLTSSFRIFNLSRASFEVGGIILPKKCLWLVIQNNGFNGGLKVKNKNSNEQCEHNCTCL